MFLLFLPIAAAITYLIMTAILGTTGGLMGLMNRNTQYNYYRFHIRGIHSREQRKNTHTPPDTH